MHSLECVTARCLLGIYWWMGLVPLPLSSQLLWLLLALLVRCIWLGYYLMMLWIGVSYLWNDKGLSISYISGTALFIGYSLLGLLIQVESALKHRTYARLDILRVQLRLRMQRLGMSRGCSRAWRLLLLLATQIGSDAARTWANAHYSISPVHIISLPQKWLLRLRYVQLLWQVMELNQRARQLRHSLLGLAAGNDLWQPYGSQEWQQLQTLRLSYDRIYECYEAFSDCYGWGMLGLQMMCGLEFVSNAYWIITEAYITQRVYMLIYNGNSCFAMGTLIVALFWYGDASANNCLIAFSMFVTVTIAHGIILLNTFLQRRTHRQLELRLDVSRLEVQNQRHVLLRVSGVVVPFLVIQTLIVWSKIGLASQWYTPIFWFSSPSDWGVQLKMIAFLADVLLANERVLCVQQSLKQLARQPNHGRQSPNVVSVIRFKEMYRELHQLFVQLNFAYGGSLLIIFIVLFFNFLFNSFWLVRHTLTRLKRPVYIYIHLGSLLNLGLLLSATCWHCQQSFNHSRQIGCLIPKLVNPMGSKRYNDLVSEFLLQALHQRFVVTAKDFFSLNLHLLSSMFAAVVTYLVILIQFMFAEKSSQATPRPEKMTTID
ncbi:uncharacterized protein LOC115759218 [Drosophila novamexicana]|uniref:uncharacterized protein LOC115759218 n=1 Tax=Drosophila novamexicana TaxID=47314 RepID=UPI0011E5F1CC|nr:uncharacterized protein LOC115759218 [Drosophila novamexicana]